MPDVEAAATVAAPTQSDITAPATGKHARSGDDPKAGMGPGLAIAGVADGAAQGGLSEGEIDAMLSQLAAQTGPPLGGVSERLDSRSAKVIAAVGLCLAATAVLLLSSFVLGAIFG